VVASADGAPAVREPRDDKGGRPPRERFQGNRDHGNKDNRDNDRPKGKFGGGRDKGGRDRDKGGRDKGDRDGRSGGGPSHRQYATSASPRERDRPVDPNSPFAKLAALKEQLTANRKDR
jgi:ATP-dependent RNA helicase SUPV3L1/SUV3